MEKITLGAIEFSIPTTKEEFAAMTNKMNEDQPGLRENTLVYYMVASDGTAVASMAKEGKFATLNILFQSISQLADPDDKEIIATIDSSTAHDIYEVFTPFFDDEQPHANIEFLKNAVDNNLEIEISIVSKNADSIIKAEHMFYLFENNLVKGEEAEARQALLDAFGVYPTKIMQPNGSSGDIEITAQNNTGMDKFETVMANPDAVAKLFEDGNRIVPSAAIRAGVGVGKENIFMFHAAVNIAANIGDQNLIDSHASVGSSAQLGNGNKIGSFVSLEGVLSPANANCCGMRDHNFLGTYARLGTGVMLGSGNFLGSNVDISLGTPLKDCREDSDTYGAHVTYRYLGEDGFNNLAVMINRSVRKFNDVEVLPGELLLFDNTEEFKARFEGDDRIKADS
ncbi:MAG: hypothetical protein U9Q15_00740 [Patescibacteria group bacterium]|nr:hypothetical protein [Patescibacteria group bacterium]